MSADAEQRQARVDAVVLDLDGTLVDSVFVHVVAWRAAFADVGLDVPAVDLHGLIGMGGDRLVTAAAGEAAEHSLGDEVRARHQEHLDRLFPAITATRGAADLLEMLHAQDVEVLLASSSDQQLTDRLLDVVGPARRLLDRVVSGSAAEVSKPSGEIIGIAIGERDPAHALVVGDTVWDVRAAQDVGARCVGVRCGGIAESTLLEAGAVGVVADPAALVAQPDVTAWASRRSR